MTLNSLDFDEDIQYETALADFLIHTLKPAKELVINKTAELDGFKLLVVSLRREADITSLYVLAYRDYNTDSELYDFPMTFSQLKSIEYKLSNLQLNITGLSSSDSQINIHFDSLSFSYFERNDYRTSMLIQHFVELGCDLSEWEERPIKNLYIIEASDTQTPLSDFDFSNISGHDLNVSISKSPQTILVDSPFISLTPNVEINKKGSFTDIYGKEREYVINKILIEPFPVFDTENNDSGNHFEYINRKFQNKSIVYIEYECDPDIQLEFFDKARLEKIISEDDTASLYNLLDEESPGEDEYEWRDSGDSSAASIGIIGGSDGPSAILLTSSNSPQRKNCVMKTVPAGFNESIEFRLFSASQDIADVTIPLI